jgi:hypothetical protein
MTTDVNQNLLDDFHVPWLNNIITDDTKITSRITRIVKLQHFLSALDTDKSYFTWPGEWRDQNDGIFLRVPFLYNGQRITHGYRYEYFAQCWCKKEGESDAMWRLYAPDPNDSVMIESTIDRVMNSIWSDDRSLVTTYGGVVRYVPLYNLTRPTFFDGIIGGMTGLTHSTGTGQVIPLLYKSNIYDHEQEFRFIFRSEGAPHCKGIFIKHTTKFSSVVNRLILHPESTSVFYQKVSAELTNRGSNIPVIVSDVYKQAPTHYVLT